MREGPEVVMAVPARAEVAVAVVVGEQLALAAPQRPAARRPYPAHARLSVPPLAATAAARGLVCCHKAVETVVARPAARDLAAECARAAISDRALESAIDLDRVIVPERAPVQDSGICLEPAVVQVLSIARAQEAALVLATVPD
jgi:hypothetical protein